MNAMLCSLMGAVDAQAAEAAITEDAFEAASAAYSRERGCADTAATAGAGAAPALERGEPSPDPNPAARLPLEHASSTAEADALLADITAVVTASEYTDASSAYIGVPQQLQEPALDQAASLDGLGAAAMAPTVTRKRGDASISISVDCGSGFTVAAADAIWGAPASQQRSAGCAEALWRSGE